MQNYIGCWNLWSYLGYARWVRYIETFIFYQNKLANCCQGYGNTDIYHFILFIREIMHWHLELYDNPCFSKKHVHLSLHSMHCFCPLFIPVLVSAWTAPSPLPSSAVILMFRAPSSSLGQSKAVVTSLPAKIGPLGWFIHL